MLIFIKYLSVLYSHCLSFNYLFWFLCGRKNREDGSDRGVDCGDWREGGEAAAHGGRHTRLRRRHQQPRLVREEEPRAVHVHTPACYTLLNTLLSQFQHHHQLHRRPVWTLPPRRERSQPQAHRRQPGSLLLLLHLSARPRVSPATWPSSLCQHRLSVHFHPSRNPKMWRLPLTRMPSVSCATSLKPLDVQFMKAIHNKVNVVPVIAKADTLTLKERERLKRRVRETVGYCLRLFCCSCVERRLTASTPKSTE